MTMLICIVMRFVFTFTVDLAQMWTDRGPGVDTRWVALGGAYNAPRVDLLWPRGEHRAAHVWI